MGTQQDYLLAVVSHDLRAPLNAIAGWVRILRSGQLDGTMAAHAFDGIERSVETQTELIEDLLDVSRIGSGNFRLQLREVNVIEVIKDPELSI